MSVSAYRYSVSGKAVWGRAILGALFAMLLLPTGSEASGRQAGKAVTAAKQATRAARIARGHATLDLQLNDAVEDAVTGKSNVIVDFKDESHAVS